MLRLLAVLAAAMPMWPQQILAPRVFPSAFQGWNYSMPLQLSDDWSCARTWFVSDGGLPPGLRVHPDGAILGAATAAGQYDFDLSVAGTGCPNLRSSFTIRVHGAGEQFPPVRFVTVNVAPGVVQSRYVDYLDIAGGSTPYTVDIVGGGLPPGLRLDGFVIEGTPAREGRYNFTVRVRDRDARTAERNLSIQVEPQDRDIPRIVSPSRLKLGVVGQAYDYQFEYDARFQPFRWSIVAGELPNGITVDNSLGPAVLKGTPSLPGSYSFVVRLTDNRGTSVSKLTTLVVIDRRMEPPLLPGGRAFQPYSQQITARDPLAPVVFDLSSGQLPRGITLAPSGLISGTPEAGGSFPITVRARDAFSTWPVSADYVAPRRIDIVEALCANFTVSPQSIEVSSAGGALKIEVLTGTNCFWSASTESPFLRVTSGSSGFGDGVIQVEAAANNESASRSGRLVIRQGANERTVTATQTGRGCRYDLPRSAIRVGPNSQRITFEVSTAPGCAWRATGQAPWITVTKDSGVGQGVVELEVNTNAGSIERSGPVIVGDPRDPSGFVTFRVSQDAQPSCSVTPNPAQINALSDGGSYSIGITVAPQCEWTAEILDENTQAASLDWIVIESGASGTGPLVPVRVRVAPNVTVRARQAFVRTGTALVTVVQSSAPAWVVSREVIRFEYETGSPRPPSETVSLFSGAMFTAAVDVRIETAPDRRWLTVTRSTRSEYEYAVDVTNLSFLEAGLYKGTIRITATGALPGSRDVAVELLVREPVSPRLVSDLPRVEVSLPLNAPPRAASLHISNPSRIPLGVELTAETGSGNWLRLLKRQDEASAERPASFLVEFAPGSLVPGVYQGRIIAAAVRSQDRLVIPVAMAVGAFSRRLEISQTTLKFIERAGEKGVIEQVIRVLNSGGGEMPWSAEVRYPAGRSANWLVLNRSSGSSQASVSGASAISARVDATALGAGSHFAEIHFLAPATDHSPQVVAVWLEVVGPNDSLGPAVLSDGLIFTGTAGGPPPSAQAFRVLNRDGRLLSFNAVGTDVGSRLWFQISPTSGNIAGQPVEIRVTPATAGLSPGVYRGTVFVAFGGVSRAVEMLLILSDPAAKASGVRMAGNCLLGGYQLLVPSLDSNFRVEQGGAALLTAVVADACGNLDDNAPTSVRFSNGDRPLDLLPVGGGRYEGVWTPSRTSGSSVSVRLTSIDPVQQLTDGSAALVGLIAGDNGAPLLQPYPLRDPSTGEVAEAIKAGQEVAVRGERLQANGEDTVVRIGGLTVNPSSVAGDQVRFVAPPGLEANVSHQLRIQRGASLSAPVTVTILR